MPKDLSFFSAVPLALVKIFTPICVPYFTSFLRPTQTKYYHDSTPTTAPQRQKWFGPPPPSDPTWVRGQLLPAASDVRRGSSGLAGVWPALVPGSPGQGAALRVESHAEGLQGKLHRATWCSAGGTDVRPWARNLHLKN